MTAIAKPSEIGAAAPIFYDKKGHASIWVGRIVLLKAIDGETVFDVRKKVYNKELTSSPNETVRIVCYQLWPSYNGKKELVYKEKGKAGVAKLARVHLVETLAYSEDPYYKVLPPSYHGKAYVYIRDLMVKDGLRKESQKRNGAGSVLLRIAMLHSLKGGFEGRLVLMSFDDVVDYYHKKNAFSTMDTLFWPIMYVEPGSIENVGKGRYKEITLVPDVVKVKGENLSPVKKEEGKEEGNSSSSKNELLISSSSSKVSS